MSSITRAIAAFTGASVIGTATQVAKGKITTVLLGAEGVGVLTQITGVTSFLSSAATLSLYNGVIRHMVGHRRDGDGEAMRAHFATNALVVTGLSLVLAGAGALAAPQVSDAIFADGGARAGLVALSMLIVPLTVIGWCYRVALNAAQDVRALVRSRILADVGSVAALAVLAWTIGLWGAVLGYIALHILFLAASWYYVRRLAPERAVDFAPRRFALPELRRNVGFGLTGLLAGLAQMGAALMIGRAIILELGLDANGIYAMAIKVSAVYLGGLAAAQGGYVFPALNAAKDAREFGAVLDEAMANGLVLVAPMAAGIMLTGEVLMRVLFSAEFVPAAALLLLLLPADLARITMQSLDSGLLARNHVITFAASRIVAAGIYLGLAIALLPVLGLTGVALAYLAENVLRALWTVPLVARLTGHRPGARVWRLGAAGVGLCVATALWVYLAPGWGVRLGGGALFLALWALAIRRDPLARAVLRRLPLIGGRA